MTKTTHLTIYTDGGSRGNPGPSALGVWIESEDGRVLARIGKTLGVNTNNFAEYSAIVEALTWVLSHKEELPKLEKISFYMDSELAVSQINGLYKVKSPHIRELLFMVREKEAEIKTPITYSHVMREANKKADSLVNMALDGKL